MRASLLLFAVGFALSPPGVAADLQVAPTLVTIAPQRAADGLTLRNSGAQPLVAQVRVFAWKQVDGEDRLSETADIAVSPPMLEIAPGAEQLVRVVRLIDAPATQEGSYRLIVDELPGPTPAPARTGLNFVLRYSVPVFLEPAATAAPVLHARLATDADGGPAVEIQNIGSARAQIADLARVGTGGRQVVAEGLAGYVLPGQTRRWSLPGALQPGAPAGIEARINGEPDARQLLPDR